MTTTASEDAFLAEVEALSHHGATTKWYVARLEAFGATSGRDEVFKVRVVRYDVGFFKKKPLYKLQFVDPDTLQPKLPEVRSDIKALFNRAEMMTSGAVDMREPISVLTHITSILPGACHIKTAL